jgi:tetratricopeptide (TPR) repeat protein
MKSFNKASFLIIFVVLVYTDNILVAQNATIREEQVELKTYPFSDPSPIANIGKIYPYYRFDGYSHQGKPQKWNMVILENDYIKVFITPQIGGKIWGAIEKSTGLAFIYYNHVVKFRNIAMRGPWTSGGVEINFGAIGHAPTCSTPIDYIAKENEDGSVSCVIGAMDLSSRTIWRVDIRLPKDGAYFEQRVLWHNPTALRQSYYHWMNGAAKAAGNLQFSFPGHNYISHGGEAFPWPIDQQDRNRAFYEMNNFGSYKSYHVIKELTDYFGGYWHDNRFGFVNWSHYGDKPGKKLWIWGLSRQGMIWEDLLTDTDGQYIEMQSGRLFNQAGASSSKTPFKHRAFTPITTDSWKEIWFPVKDTHGIANASSFGTLNIITEKNSIKIFLCPIKKIEDTLIVKIDDESVYSRHLLLNPMQAFSDSFKITNKGKIVALLGDGKIQYSSDQRDDNYLQRPLEMPADFDWNTVYGLALGAEEMAKQRNYEEAIDYYLQCLNKDPNYLDALVGLAELSYRKMEYKKGLQYARRALSIDTYNGSANFIYGLISLQLGNRTDAKDGFSIASQSIEYRSAAYTKISEMYAQESHWGLASEVANRALNYNNFNLNAYQLIALSFRKQKRKVEAKETLENLLEMDPLNHFAYFEKYLLDTNSKTQKTFQSSIRNEFPYESYLELALYYFNLNMIDEAINVLNIASENPIIYYWLAYLYDFQNDTNASAEYINLAEELSPYLVFPFRKETEHVLQWALKRNEHWKTKYYLALIYLNKGKTNGGRKLLAECGEIPDYAPFYLTRAKYATDNDGQSSIRDCQRSMNLDKSQWRSWVMLSNFYRMANDEENALNTIEKVYQQNPEDFRLGLPYAKALYLSQKYKECIVVLNNINVLPYEGSGEGRRIYRDAHLMYALQLLEEGELDEALSQVEISRLWPESLGAGRPYEVDERSEDFIEMFIRDKLSDNDEVDVLLNKIIEETEPYGGEPDPSQVLGILALQKQGKKSQALAQVQKWQQEVPDDMLAEWAHNFVLGKMKAAKGIMEELRADSYSDVLHAALRFYSGHYTIEDKQD